MFDNSGYTPKDLVFGDEGRERLIDGIKKIAAAVKSTLGPGGNTVLIESPNHTHSITVTKDGVTVAKKVNLSSCTLGRNSDKYGLITKLFRVYRGGKVRQVRYCKPK